MLRIATSIAVILLISFISCQKNSVCLTDDEIQLCMATNPDLNEVEMRRSLSGKWSLVQTQVIYGLDGESDECSDQNITLRITGSGDYTIHEGDQLLESGTCQPDQLVAQSVWVLEIEPPSIYFGESVLFCQSYARFSPFSVSDGRINIYQRID